MKKICVLILVVFLFGVVFAQEGPSSGVGSEDVEAIENLTEKIPIDPDTGRIDPGRLGFEKSKAEKRVEAINEYVGPITKILWGQELTLSWIFVFAFVVWILLIEFIVVPVSSIFDWGIWWSLLGATIVSTLAMQGLGQDLALWMESLAVQWWAGILVLFVAGIVGFFYSAFFKYVGKKSKEAREKEEELQTKMDRKILNVEAEAFRKELKSKKSGGSIFDVLGISEDASYEEAHRVFREMAMKTHPDRGGKSEDFIKIKDAWDEIKKKKGW